MIIWPDVGCDDEDDLSSVDPLPINNEAAIKRVEIAEIMVFVFLRVSINWVVDYIPVSSLVIIWPDVGCVDEDDLSSVEPLPIKSEAAIKRVEIAEIMVFVFWGFVKKI